MRDLQRAASRRHAAELELAAATAAAQGRVEERYQRTLAEANAAFQTTKQGIDDQFGKLRTELVTAYEAERGALQSQYHTLRTAAETERRETEARAAHERKETAFQIMSIYDGQRDQPKERLVGLMGELKSRQAELGAIEADTREILRMRGAPQLASEWTLPAAAAEPHAWQGADEEVVTALGELDDAIASARSTAEGLLAYKLPRLFEEGIVATLTGAGGVLGLVAVGFTLGWTNWLSYALGVLLAGATFALLKFVVHPQAIGQLTRGREAVGRALVAAKVAVQRAVDAGKQRSVRHAQQLVEHRDQELAELNTRLDQLLSDTIARTTAQLEAAGGQFPAELTTRRQQHEQALTELDGRHRQALTTVIEIRDQALAAAEETRQREAEEVTHQRDQDFQALFSAWLSAYDDVRATLRDMRAECQRLFPDFTNTPFAEWPQPTEVAPAIQFGEVVIDLARVKHGIAEDQRLVPPETKLVAPALMTLAEHPVMVVEAEGEARGVAIDLLQSTMLRMLTAMPAGKVRFTILDPIGLGDNFQSFMHLADFDEQFIAGRIWSEGRDIDEQTLRLTAHMETVIQKYLRNEYADIHAYNAQAGEVAEPFQVLVIAGFPTNFSEAALRRLLSIVTGGPRCGIYTLIALDRRVRLPNEFRLDELKSHAVCLEWVPDDGRFVWNYPAFERLPLTLAELPPAAQLVDTLRQAGQRAKEAVRVEVPFSVVMPTTAEMWAGDCGDELCIPLGRAGANRLQYVRLGKGTSQHLLVAGKTGSGKSTFLHALVTSAALRFSPEELQFYLVDFKKGVEFKSYATHRLPHARVIAIESEREFGISVLERLDEELRRRGEMYRTSGVQNVADYRSAHPGESLPRILLIIDEFQELFTEDDKLAQEASLLMDRLVRQGRAFGIHVILGTQTLAGAYSIARSTLGQIAIRVALECSEADSHLILSDERNQAARFLSRPGEAIYNDQNGMVSANEPFQVVWLSERERAAILDSLDDYRHAHDREIPQAIVFEGNAPADPATIPALADNAAPPAGGIPRAWLGDAVAIKPPTSVLLGRHAGANLLVVGPHPHTAIGTLTSAAISLAAESIALGAPARIIILDGARPQDEASEVWGPVASALGAELHGAGGVASTLTSIAAEVARREATADDAAPGLFLIISNAGRFRDLRRNEDDFSFSSSRDKPAAPDKQLAEILRNGPARGVHVLVWCDSYNNVLRLFDRSTLREFSQRVVLQVSAADSSNLIDSPAASQLKSHRALLYSDDTGETEKFRPYGPPSPVVLAELKAREFPSSRDATAAPQRS